MNLSTAIFLINDAVRAILVTYQEGEKPVMFKSFDKSIKVDDLVAVKTNTRHGMTVCKVVKVDADVDFDDSTLVEWLVGRVDVADFNHINMLESAAVEAIRAAEKLKKKKELQENMEALLASSGGGTKLLAISSIGDKNTEEVSASTEIGG